VCHPRTGAGGRKPSVEVDRPYPYRRGYAARQLLTLLRIGNASRHFTAIRDWVEGKVRRHLQRAARRTGFGWKRWSRAWFYNGLGLYNDYSIRHARITPKALPAR
jgi:hypothetical protein